MGSSGNSTPLGNTPVREHAAAIAESVALFSERVKTPMNNDEETSMVSHLFFYFIIINIIIFISRLILSSRYHHLQTPRKITS